MCENGKNIKRVMQAPVNEIINDSAAIEWNEMWREEPIDLEERRMFIANRVLKAPKLIPIYSHRYVASFESKELPVFSICGSDIICLVKKLADYFEFEFYVTDFETKYLLCYNHHD